MLSKVNKIIISKKHSVIINGHRTSVTLENEFWEALKEISKIKKQSINNLMAEIDKKQLPNLSSAARIFILNFYKDKNPLSSRKL